MAETYLNKCRCGGDGEFVLEQGDVLIFARCKRCGIRTPSKGASLDYAAKQQVADVWNAGTLLWLPWIKPAVQADAYQPDDRVSHKGNHWISIRENNVWEPGESGWRLVGPAPDAQGGTV